MRAFIVLALIAVARGDVGGYNYGAGTGGLGGSSLHGGSLQGALGGGSDLGGSLHGGLGGGSLHGGLGGGSLHGGALQGGLGVGSDLGGSLHGGLGGGSLHGSSLQGGLGGGSDLGSSLNGGLGGGSLHGGSLQGGLGGGLDLGGSLNGGLGGGSNLGGGYGQASAELEKEYYTFTAPEAEFEDHQPVQDFSSSLKKNLQVVFIRGPENNGLANAAVNLAKSASDSKTAIYVLTKQNDASQLAHKLQSLHIQKASRPEVHFVKYRTHEDAQRAQQAIQSQYDSLGGTSLTHNGGVAPVLDYTSKGASAGTTYGASAGNTYGASAGNAYIPPQAPSNTYLPN